MTNTIGTQYRDAASNSRKAGHDPRCGRERRQEARRVGLEHKGSGPKRKKLVEKQQGLEHETRATGYPPALIHYVGPLPVVVCAIPIPTPEDIAADLRELSLLECAELGIRHSSEDDHSTAIFPGDNQHIKRMEFCYSTNKSFWKVKCA